MALPPILLEFLEPSGRPAHIVVGRYPKSTGPRPLRLFPRSQNAGYWISAGQQIPEHETWLVPYHGGCD